MNKIIKEADLNGKKADSNEWTPLHHACKWGYISIVKFLVKNDEDVNAQDINNFTPLL